MHYRRYRLPFRVPVQTAHGLWAEREGLLLRLADEAGAVGWGEVAPLASFGTESAEQAEAACAALGGWIEEPRLRAPAGLRCLSAAFRAARLDLAGGGASPAGCGAAGRLPVAALLPAGVAALGALRRAAEAEFRTFKWKVGVFDVADELGLLDELCAGLPAGGRLRLDANGAWDRRGADRWLGRCAERPVEFVEQPVARGADDLLRGLAGDFPTPIALDESLAGGRDIEHWLAAGWPGLYVVKPSLLEDAESVLARLAASKSEVVFSSVLETAVGARFALRTAFDWPGRVRALGFGVWPLFGDQTFDGPAANPFFSRAEVERMDPEILWNALS